MNAFLLTSLLGLGSCKKDWVDTKPKGAPSLAYQ